MELAPARRGSGMEKSDLVAEVCPPLDPSLFVALVDEFVSMEQRFFLGDWEPATLDGGQFGEAMARLIYSADSGNLSPRKPFDDCLKWIEDEKRPHSFPTRRAALHLCRVLRTIYKFRSQRGAVHIDPEYSANELDTGLLMANVRWLFADLLRIFWTGSPSDIARTVRDVVRYRVPAILEVDGRHLVMRTDCSVDEEILILLHHVGASGAARRQLGEGIPRPAPRISEALRRLKADRQVVVKADGCLILSPNGCRRVFIELAEKLALE